MERKWYLRKRLLTGTEVRKEIYFDSNYSFRVGVLGLCAIVLSSPYDIPDYVPEALMYLCEHSHDPDLIQVRFILIFFYKIDRIIYFDRNQ